MAITQEEQREQYEDMSKTPLAEKRKRHELMQELLELERLAEDEE